MRQFVVDLPSFKFTLDNNALTKKDLACYSILKNTPCSYNTSYPFSTIIKVQIVCLNVMVDYKICGEETFPKI